MVMQPLVVLVQKTGFMNLNPNTYAPNSLALALPGGLHY